MNADAKFWEEMLEDGESLLWCGRPQTGIRFKPSGWMRLALGGAFIGLGLAVVWLGTSDGQSTSPWAFYALAGLLVLGGLYWLALDWFVDAALRRRTRYAITDERALIYRFGLQSYAIRADSPLEIWSRDPASVIFAQSEVQTRTTTIAKIGFHALEKPDAVLEILTGVRDSRLS